MTKKDRIENREKGDKYLKELVICTKTFLTTDEEGLQALFGAKSSDYIISHEKEKILHFNKLISKICEF